MRNGLFTQPGKAGVLSAQLLKGELVETLKLSRSLEKELMVLAIKYDSLLKKMKKEDTYKH